MVFVMMLMVGISREKELMSRTWSVFDFGRAWLCLLFRVISRWCAVHIGVGSPFVPFAVKTRHAFFIQHFVPKKLTIPKKSICRTPSVSIGALCLTRPLNKNRRHAAQTDVAR